MSKLRVHLQKGDCSLDMKNHVVLCDGILPTAHVSPSYPLRHEQVNPLTSFVQVPYIHGLP